MIRILSSSIAFTMITGCGAGTNFRNALPDEDVVQVPFPARGESAGGLVGTTASGLVGGPADFYTHTYYASRAVNGFALHVVRAVQRVAALPATSVSLDTAVWGPFSADGEPIEYRLTIRDLGAHQDWHAELRHKSASDFVLMAGGSFEPVSEELGRGWFAVDFDAIRSVNLAEPNRGRISYAFERTAEALNVRAYASRELAGTTEEAGYAYGKSAEGAGFVMFAVPENIAATSDFGFEDTGAKERLLIHSRWSASGSGRADALVAEGDLGSSAAIAAQCWNDRFASTFEAVGVDGTIRASSGDPSSCVADPEVPEATDLPDEDGVANPHVE